jgi:hypothetical protein
MTFKYGSIEQGRRGFLKNNWGCFFGVGQMESIDHRDEEIRVLREIVKTYQAEIKVKDERISVMQGQLEKSCDMIERVLKVLAFESYLATD